MRVTKVAHGVFLIGFQSNYLLAATFKYAKVFRRKWKDRLF